MVRIQAAARLRLTASMHFVTADDVLALTAQDLKTIPEEEVCMGVLDFMANRCKDCAEAAWVLGWLDSQCNPRTVHPALTSEVQDYYDRAKIDPPFDITALD